MLTSEVAKIIASGKEIGFSTGHIAGKITGAIEGREEFLNSEEFAICIRETRLQGAFDFLKAPAFEAALEIKATDFLMQGFDRCKAQVTNLNGFACDFDVSRLNPTLDANLQPFVDEDAPPTGEDK
ncbi:UNVERIFIED_CONTAM: hypothetical protein Sindi_0977900 [Sesamum indicum]